MREVAVFLRVLRVRHEVVRMLIVVPFGRAGAVGADIKFSGVRLFFRETDVFRTVLGEDEVIYAGSCNIVARGP